jgi:GNAT superfamily N-acetyltransferase
MTTQLTIALEDKPSQADTNAIVQNLLAYNQSQSDGATPHYLVATVKDTDGQLQGGVVAAAYLGWLSVHAIWLSETLRGQGYGTALMDLVEDAGARSGCANVFLETLHFQALPFYEKRGYTIFSRLADFPPGGARYALTKPLKAVTAEP